VKRIGGGMMNNFRRCTKTFTLFYVSAVLFFFTTSASAETINKNNLEKFNVILVPGFFSSLAYGYVKKDPTGEGLLVAPYWSQHIVESLEQRGHHVWVVDNLDPLGGLEANGLSLMHYLDELKSKDVLSSRRTIILAHSAGGLYSLFALTHSHFHADALVTVSTPYKGLELIKNLDQSLPLAQEALKFIQLDSLLELEPTKVESFLKGIHVPDDLRILAVAGVHRTNYN
jgi:hypothetical protein